MNISFSMNLKKQLEKFLSGERWFMGKNRCLQSIYIKESITVAENIFLWILEIHYKDHSSEYYQLPVKFFKGKTFPKNQLTPVFKNHAGIFYEAFNDTEFLNHFLIMLFNKKKLQGTQYSFSSHIIFPYKKNEMPKIFLKYHQEQSNSSILFPRFGFLKFIRKIEPGIHPEIEMNQYLQNKRFPSSAIIFGSWEYKIKNQRWSSALLQQDLSQYPNAWDQFKRNNFPEFFKKLGQKTAQIHILLAESETQSFRPQKFTPHYFKKLIEKIKIQGKETQHQLKQSLIKRNFPYKNLARKTLLLLEQNLDDLLIQSLNQSEHGKRIRIHGDLHLGQILYQKNKFYFIDFEGEPARPLKERREKHSPLKDLAGILRSIDYARIRFSLQNLPDYSEILVQSYIKALQRTDLLSGDAEINHQLLRIYILEKTLYEIRYELSNRPDWFNIPAIALKKLLEDLK